MDTLNQLQQSVTTNVTSTVNEQLSKIFEQFVVPSLIVTGIIVLLYIVRAIHRYKVDRAIFEIRDNLREMKAAQTPKDRDETSAS